MQRRDARGRCCSRPESLSGLRTLGEPWGTRRSGNSRTRYVLGSVEHRAFKLWPDVFVLEACALLPVCVASASQFEQNDCQFPRQGTHFSDLDAERSFERRPER